MRTIFSEVKSDTVICTYIGASDYLETRSEMCQGSDILQVSARRLELGFEVPRHRHLPIARHTLGTSEIWVVLQGAVAARVWDLDGKELDKFTLKSHEVAVFHAGGHSLESLEEDTRFVEIKNGPYFGRTKDKVEF
jgi:hypothetical protein